MLATICGCWKKSRGELWLVSSILISALPRKLILISALCLFVGCENQKSTIDDAVWDTVTPTSVSKRGSPNGMILRVYQLADLEKSNSELAELANGIQQIKTNRIACNLVATTIDGDKTSHTYGLAGESGAIYVMVWGEGDDRQVAFTVHELDKQAVSSSY